VPLFPTIDYNLGDLLLEKILGPAMLLLLTQVLKEGKAK